MSPRILVACYEIPGYGGAATAAYRLFEVLRENGLDVRYLNLIEKRDEDFYRFVFGESFGNPRAHEDVFTEVLGEPLYAPHAAVGALLRELDVDVILACGFVAARVIELSAPERKVALLASGCQQAKDAIVHGRARDVSSLSAALEGSLRRPSISCPEEQAAVDAADLVFVHSEMVGRLFRAYFPLQAGKIYRDVISFAEWIHGDALGYADRARPFGERDVDALFVASSWLRPEKNYAFVGPIAAELPHAVVHVVGEFDEPVDGAVHHGLVGDRSAFFDLMGRAKCVVCPSSFDAAPGILFEASALGCNVVASANCGNAALCNERLLVEHFTPTAFAERIRMGLERKHADSIERFLAMDSVRKLIETLEVM